MLELFSFFNEGVLADCSEKLRNRLTLVCNIIAKLYLKGEKKSWFWKIRHILYLFEDYFTEKNDRYSLMPIISYYCFFDDVHRQKRFLLKKGNDEDGTIFLSEFFNKFFGSGTLSDLMEFHEASRKSWKIPFLKGSSAS